VSFAPERFIAPYRECRVHKPACFVAKIMKNTNYRQKFIPTAITFTVIAALFAIVILAIPFDALAQYYGGNYSDYNNSYNHGYNNHNYGNYGGYHNNYSGYNYYSGYYYQPYSYSYYYPVYTYTPYYYHSYPQYGYHHRWW